MNRKFLLYFEVKGNNLSTGWSFSSSYLTGQSNVSRAEIGGKYFTMQKIIHGDKFNTIFYFIFMVAL